MIARVDVPDKPPCTLILGEDRRWTSELAPHIASAFTLLHADTYGEWNGQPGHWQAHDDAKRLKDTVTYLCPVDPDPDRSASASYDTDEIGQT
jgi:hypothetical protein